MPRGARILGDDITYHVVANCNAKELLFKTASDFKLFLGRLEECQKQYPFELHAYCLLHSHVHLMLTTRSGNFLDRVMYEICQRFSVSYNKCWSRVGHFWKNRYFCKVISDDAYGLVCLRYLHRNPLKAKLVAHPTQWNWSCVKNYLTGEFDNLLTPLPSYLGLSDDLDKRKQLYKNWLETPFLSEEVENRLMSSGMRVGSDRFRRVLRLQVKPLLVSLSSGYLLQRRVNR